MERLIDKARAVGFLTESHLDVGAPAIVVDNVHEYMATNPKTTWAVSDFPNVAPPFSSYWMETMHARSESGTGGIGAAFKATELTAEVRRDHLAAWQNADHEKRDEWREIYGMAQRENVRWMVLAFVLFEVKHQVMRGPILQYGVGHDGAANDAMTIFLQKDVLKNPSERPEFEDFVLSAVMPMFMATSLMHCKNVEVEDRIPQRVLRRQAQRNGNKPPVTYKVLTIEPMQRVLRAAGASISDGETIKHALHIMRGHFKDYRQRGVFGKHHGVYWWGDMVRGTADRVVEKSYNIIAPPQEKGK